MAESRARFRFITDRAVEVSTKRLLARAALQQSRDNLAFINRAASLLQPTVGFLGRVAEIEANLLNSNLLEDAEANREDLRMALEAARLLEGARSLVGELRRRKLGDAVALEEAMGPIFFPKPKPQGKLKPRGKLKTKGKAQPTPQVLNLIQAQPMVLTPADPPRFPETPNPGPIVLNLDPKLLEKARKEIAAKTRKQDF